MLRCLLWRLLFELANLRRLLGHGDQTVEYLAFGANLSDAIMRERRIRPLASEYFTLRDHGLRFDHPAAYRGCAYASAEYAAGERVHGFLYTLYERDAARMDFYEVVPVIERYRRTWVEQDGRRLFFYQSNRSTPGLSPTREYLGYIVDGLAQHPDVEPEYLEQMAATPTAEPGPIMPFYFRSEIYTEGRWLDRLRDRYTRLVTRVFLHGLYRLSLTEFLLRR